MKQYTDLFDRLMDSGVVYRYTKDQWEKLQLLGGKIYPSPIQKVMVDGFEYIEELIQPSLEPFIIAQGEWARLVRLSSCWGKFLSAQLRIFQDYPDIAKRVATPQELRFGNLSSGYRCFAPFIRLDCVRDDEGILRVVDINSTRPAGVGDTIALQEIMAPEQAEWVASAFCTTVRTCFQQWLSWKGIVRPARIGMLTDKEADYWNFKILSRVLAKQEWVERVDIISEILPHNDFNCIIRSRIKEDHPQFIALQKLYPEKVCLISPLYRRWVGNKLWMYLCKLQELSSVFYEYLGYDYQWLVTEVFADTAVLQGGTLHFPNGKGLSTEKLDRGQWVMKAPAGSSCIGTIFGRAVSKIKWEELVNNLPDGHIFQRYHQAKAKERTCILGKEGIPEIQDFYIKYGVFIFNGVLGGVEVMARKRFMVHGARDTYLSFAVSA